MTTSRKEFQRQFWSGLESVFHARGLEWPKNTPKQCKDFRLGKGGITLFLGILPDRNLLTIGLALDGDSARENFEFLHRSRQQIETQLDLNLNWKTKSDKKRFSITFKKSVDDLEDRTQWADHHNWMANLLPRFRSVFGPYIGRM